MRNETPPRGGEREQHDAAVAAGGPAAHQAAPYELVHDIGGARRFDQDAALHLAHRQPALVVQHFQHPELRRPQSEARDTRPGMLLHGIERPGQDDPELQGGVGSLRQSWHLAFGNRGTGLVVPRSVDVEYLDFEIISTGGCHNVC